MIGFLLIGLYLNDHPEMIRQLYPKYAPRTIQHWLHQGNIWYHHPQIYPYLRMIKTTGDACIRMVPLPKAVTETYKDWRIK
jgi:hypothetical protein